MGPLLENDDFMDIGGGGSTPPGSGSSWDFESIFESVASFWPGGGIGASLLTNFIGPGYESTGGGEIRRQLDMTDEVNIRYHDWLKEHDQVLFNSGDIWDDGPHDVYWYRGYWELYIGMGWKKETLQFDANMRPFNLGSQAGSGPQASKNSMVIVLVAIVAALVVFGKKLFR